MELRSKPPVDTAIGIFELDTFSSKGQSLEEHEAIFIKSTSDSIAQSTESSSKG